jgi:cell division protein FtsN
MLRARDFDNLPSDRLTQKRRMRRQRILEIALPCAIIAALIITMFCTVSHASARARTRAARAHTNAALLLAQGDGQLAAPPRLESMLSPIHEATNEAAEQSHSGQAHQEQEQPREQTVGQQRVQIEQRVQRRQQQQVRQQQVRQQQVWQQQVQQQQAQQVQQQQQQQQQVRRESLGQQVHERREQRRSASVLMPPPHTLAHTSTVAESQARLRARRTATGALRSSV